MRPTCRTARFPNRRARQTGQGTVLRARTASDAGPSNKSHSTAAGSRYGGRGRREYRSLPPSILPAAQSAELRDRLIAEIAAIASSEQAEDWARKALPTKNTLAVADAQAIEQAFERRLIELNEPIRRGRTAASPRAGKE